MPDKYKEQSHCDNETDCYVDGISKSDRLWETVQQAQVTSLQNDLVF